jgi:hypothetical protein
MRPARCRRPGRRAARSTARRGSGWKPIAKTMPRRSALDLLEGGRPGPRARAPGRLPVMRGGSAWDGDTPREHRGGGRLGVRTTYAVVGLAASLAVALRLPFVHDQPYADEGGTLMVARQWHSGGPFLYGNLFLDRPPLFVVFFRAGVALGGIVPVRMLGLVLVAVAVAAAASAGSVLAGRRGACTAAVVAAALLADPALGTRAVIAETVGAPVTLAAAACMLEATRRASTRRSLLVTGGFLAVCALLVKQNLADALAFGVVLVVGSAVAAGGRRAALGDLGWLAVGAAVPVAATLVWAATCTPGVHTLGYALYGFRVDGIQVLLANGTASQAARLRDLLSASVLSGLVPVVIASLWSLRRRPARDPVRLALLAMLVVAVAGVLGGGSYWTHYLIAIVPVAALLAAAASGASPRSPVLGLVVAATLASTLIGATSAVRSRTPASDTWLGATTAWMRSTEQPRDSVVVLYGDAALYETTGLRPAYPYVWTLPMHVLDPQLTGLRALLAGGRAPTFVIVRSPLDTGGAGPGALVQRTIDQHFRRVAVVCGSSVYLRRGVSRPDPTPLTGCGADAPPGVPPTLTVHEAGRFPPA